MELAPRKTARRPGWFLRSQEISRLLSLLIGCLFLSAVLAPLTVRAEGVPQHLASMAKDLFVQSKAELKNSTGDPSQDAVRRRARKILKEAGIRYWAREEVRAGSAKEKPRKHTMTVGDNDDQLDITWDPEKNSFEIRIKARETNKGAGDGFDFRLNGDVSPAPQTGGENAILSVRPRDQAISVLTDEELNRLLGDIFGEWRSGDGEVWEISDPGGGGKAKPPPPAPKNDENPKVGEDGPGDKDQESGLDQIDKSNPVPDPYNKGSKIEKRLLDLYQEYQDRSENDFNQAQESIHGKKRPAEETDAYRSLRDRRDRVDGNIKSLEGEYSGRIEDASQANKGLKKAFKDIKETPENPKGKQEQDIIEKALKGDLSKQEKKKLNELRQLIDWINRLRDARATLDDMQKLLEDTGSIYSRTALLQDGGGNADQPSERPEDRIAKLKRQIEKVRTEKVHRWRNRVTGEVVLQEPDKFKKLKEPFEHDPGGKMEIARLEAKIKEIGASYKPPPVVANDPVGMDKMRASGKAQSLTIQVTDKDGYSWTYDTALMLNGRITASRTLRNVKDSPKMPPYMMRQAIASFSPPEWIELEVKLDVATRQVHMTGQRWRMHYDHQGNSLTGGGKRTVTGIHTPWPRDLRLIRKFKDKSVLRFVREGDGGFEEIEGNLRYYGGPIFLEVDYEKEQEEDSFLVTLKWDDAKSGTTGRTKILVSRTPEDATLYRSGGIDIEPWTPIADRAMATRPREPQPLIVSP